MAEKQTQNFIGMVNKRLLWKCTIACLAVCLAFVMVFGVEGPTNQSIEDTTAFSQFPPSSTHKIHISNLNDDEPIVGVPKTKVDKSEGVSGSRVTQTLPTPSAPLSPTSSPPLQEVRTGTTVSVQSGDVTALAGNMLTEFVIGEKDNLGTETPKRVIELHQAEIDRRFPLFNRLLFPYLPLSHSEDTSEQSAEESTQVGEPHESLDPLKLNSMVISGNQTALVIFTSSWCFVCDEVFQMLKVVAQSLDDAASVKAYFFDVGNHGEAAGSVHVFKVPSIMVISKGSLIRYEGVIRAPVIQRFVRKQLGALVENVKDVGTWVKRSQVSVILFCPSNGVYKTLSQSYNTLAARALEVQFGYQLTNSHTNIDPAGGFCDTDDGMPRDGLLSPTLMLTRNDDTDTSRKPVYIYYSGNVNDQEAIFQFIQSNSFPSVIPLTDRSVEYLLSTRYFAVVFITDAHANHKNVYRELERIATERDDLLRLNNGSSAETGTTGGVEQGNGTLSDKVAKGGDHVEGSYPKKMDSAKYEKSKSGVDTPRPHVNERISLVVAKMASTVGKRLHQYLFGTSDEISWKDVSVWLVRSVREQSGEVTSSGSVSRLLAYQIELNNTYADLLEVVSDVEADKIEPFMKSEVSGISDNQYLHKLTGNEYNSFIKNSKKDLLILYYSPSCIHSIRALSVFKVVATMLASEESVILAYIDETKNDVHTPQISQYPTVYLFKPQRHNLPIRFEEVINVDNIISFVQTFGTVYGLHYDL